MTSEHASIEHVAVILPTYNRKHLLVRTLQAVLQQSYPVSSVYIIDNAGADGTRDFLQCEGIFADPRIHYLRLSRNVGPSGAYYFGMSRAVADGADWVWIVDDDSEAQCSTLERLITSGPASDPQTVAVCPTLLHSTGEFWPNTRGYFRPRQRRLSMEKFTGLKPIDSAIYKEGPQPIDWGLGLGLLVRACAIRAVGAPKREFFYGNTDIEYTLRLSRHGPLWLIPTSIMLHAGDSDGTPSSGRRWLRRLLPIPPITTPIESYWRDILAHRNHAWLMKQYGRESLGSYLLRLSLMIAVIALCDDRPLLRVRMLAAFGLQGRLETFRRLTPERWQEIIG